MKKKEGRTERKREWDGWREEREARVTGRETGRGSQPGQPREKHPNNEAKRPLFFTWQNRSVRSVCVLCVRACVQSEHIQGERTEFLTLSRVRAQRSQSTWITCIAPYSAHLIALPVGLPVGLHCYRPYPAIPIMVLVVALSLPASLLPSLSPSFSFLSVAGWLLSADLIIRLCFHSSSTTELFLCSEVSEEFQS